ncbi:hypothetical protein M9H77_12208 [Catharanthus roseus]|uniref:Uncharacterized protein n=1 Tax=Catharanthus roseus TaxID=4058 RepID=A0ACC0BGV2_CATRO|nr:hypothetical protein M9H77_12208 [Catharanthus roseus]
MLGSCTLDMDPIDRGVVPWEDDSVTKSGYLSQCGPIGFLNDVNRLDMQEHHGTVTRAKKKQLKSHKDQIEQEKFQGLNFYVQDFMGQYAKSNAERIAGTLPSRN